LQKREHPLFSVFGEAVQVKNAVLGGRGIDFEVAGVDHDAQRRADSQRNAVHQTMGHADRMKGERSQPEAVAGSDLVQLHFVEQTVFFQFAFSQRERKFRAVNGDIEFAQNPWQAADVVFVAVSENDAANLIPVLQQVRDVWNNDVYAQQFRLGEHQAGVDHDDVVAPADDHAVHTELTESAERNKLELACGHVQNI